jgi:hypothetical protein
MTLPDIPDDQVPIEQLEDAEQPQEAEQEKQD